MTETNSDTTGQKHDNHRKKYKYISYKSDSRCHEGLRVQGQREAPTKPSAVS